MKNYGIFITYEKVSILKYSFQFAIDKNHK